MWKCKECGGEIVAELELLKSNNFITKDKKVFLKDININIIDFYCKECGNVDIVRFTYGDATLMQNKFDEYCIPENEKLYKFILKKYGNYVCQQCGASSGDLEDIADWEEEEC